MLRRLDDAHGRAALTRVLKTLDGVKLSIISTCLNPYIDFATGPIPSIAEDDGEQGDFTDQDFSGLLHDLYDGPPNARQMVRDAAERSSYDMWNKCYRRILCRDLPIDFHTFKHHPLCAAEGLMLDVEWGSQIATKAKKPPARGEVLVDARLSGERVLVLPRKAEHPVFHSATGNRLSGFDLRPLCASLYQRLPGPVVLDGIITPRTRWGYMEASERAEPCLALIDIIPLPEFRAGTSQQSQALRHAMLTLLETSGVLAEMRGRIWVMPKMEINLAGTEGRENLEQFRQQALLAGHKGVIIKDKSAVYQRGQTRNWLEVPC